MTARHAVKLVAVSVLSAAVALSVGCFSLKVNAEVPEHISTGPRSQHRAGPDANTRWTPYAAELDDVLRQQKTVERELSRRDWEELADEIGDWRKQVHRLNGVADTTRDPDRMRHHCGNLLNDIGDMVRASRNRDAKAVGQALDKAAPTLDALSREFPLTEPIPPSEMAPEEQ